MKRFISIFMIIGALMCVLYMGVAAEPNEGGSDETSSAVSGDETTSDSIIGNVSIEGGSSEEDGGDELESDLESQPEEETNSSDTSTSSRYGAGAYDETGSGTTEFGSIPSGSDGSKIASTVIVTPNKTEDKNITQLKSIAWIAIIVTIVLIVACVSALIIVNRKAFTFEKGKAKDGKTLRKKKK